MILVLHHWNSLKSVLLIEFYIMHLIPEFPINRWKGPVYKLSCNKYWCRGHWSNKGWFPSSVWACGSSVAFLCIRACTLTCGVLGRCEGCTAQNSKPNEREKGSRGTGDHWSGGNGVRTATWQVSYRVLHVLLKLFKKFIKFKQRKSWPRWCLDF